MMLPSRRLPPATQELYRQLGWWAGPSLVDEIAGHACAGRSALAVVDASGRFTYADLWRDATRFAAHLQSVGVRPGDVVSIQLPNRYTAIVAGVGAHLCAAVVNPLLPNYRGHELAYILEKAETKVLVVPDVHRGFDHRVLAAELRSHLPTLHLVVDGEPGDHEAASLAGALADPTQEWRPPTSPDLAAVTEVIFTSGTEARPKPVMHTEETVNFSLRNAARLLGLGPDDVAFVPSPVGHSTGFNACVRLALLHGIPIVLLDKWDPVVAAELVAAERCSYTLAATTFLDDLVGVAEERGIHLDSMRLFGCGGAPVPPPLVRRAAAVGIQVLRIYGSTETMLVSWNRPESPADKRESTDGLVLDHVEVEVRDDAQHVLGPGAIGELYVRGPNLFAGYYESPNENAAAFDPSGEWFGTGDLGSLDPDGYLTIQGRKKEIIIRGGLNIAPREIEELLEQIDGVAAAAVLGLPDERLGEITCACLVLSDPHMDLTADDVLAHLRGSDLALYKHPQRVEFVDELPRTASGKVAKHRLRDLVLAPEG